MEQNQDKVIKADESDMDQEKALVAAKELVEAEIDKHRNYFLRIVNGESDPGQIDVDIRTSAGYEGVVKVDAKLVASIYLRHEMEISRVLDNVDIPEQIFIDLAQTLGVSEVCSADL